MDFERRSRNRRGHRGRWQGTPGAKWRWFELKTDLAAGGTATAYVLDTVTGARLATGDPTKDEFEIKSFVMGFFGDGSTEGGMAGSDEGTGAKGVSWRFTGPSGAEWRVINISCP